MNTTKKWRNQADTFHLVYGGSIIILAIVVALLAHAVITGKEFIGIDSEPQKTPVDFEVE